MVGSVHSQYIPAAGWRRGFSWVASPGTSPLAFLEFGLITLARGDPPVRWGSGDREAVLYLIDGAGRITLTGPAGEVAASLDSRRSFFDGVPSAVYAPPGSLLTVAASEDHVRLALFTAPPTAPREARVIGPSDVTTRTVGADNWTRRVHLVVDDRIASRLLVGETINPAGNWSSYPPHKHDATLPDRELPMEEIYYFLVQPPGGFGLQMVYSTPDDPAPFQEIHRVGDGDTVVIPRGYHPVVAAGGYQLAYLWAISGEHVAYSAWSNDPAHAWLIR